MEPTGVGHQINRTHIIETSLESKFHAAYSLIVAIRFVSPREVVVEDVSSGDSVCCYASLRLKDSVNG